MHFDKLKFNIDTLYFKDNIMMRVAQLFANNPKMQ